MLTLDHDRRLGPRLPVARPCKVYEPRSRRYVAGSTCNISAGGMLLRLDRSLTLEPGDRLFVAVAQKRRQKLLHGDEMREMEVVRSATASNGATALGLRFRDAAQDETGLLSRAA